ncbi:hypothetical protein D3C71_1833260 [compost metagenome]
MKNADEMIEEIADELESSNYHDISSIPEMLWNDIKGLIPEENLEKVAQKFVEAFRI